MENLGPHLLFRREGMIQIARQWLSQLEEISRYEDKPESVAHYATLEVFWSAQVLDRPILGLAEMIRTISCETTSWPT
jgi:predicted Zn-dependent peptidase